MPLYYDSDEILGLPTKLKSRRTYQCRMDPRYFEHKIKSEVSYLLLGHTAETINKHEEFVLGLWDELKRKTSRKKCKLNDASEFHKLNNEVRTLCMIRFFFP